MAPSSSLVEPGLIETTCDAPLSVSTQEEESFLQSMFDHVNRSFSELALTMAVDSSSDSPVLTITKKNLFNHPPFGLTSHIQVIVQHTSYTASVLMRTWKVGEVRSVEDIIKLCHDFSNKSVYKFCPGIDLQYYEEEYIKLFVFISKVSDFANSHSCVWTLIIVSSGLFQPQTYLLWKNQPMKLNVQHANIWFMTLIVKRGEQLPIAQAERSNGNFHHLEQDCDICHRLARRSVSCMHSMKG